MSEVVCPIQCMKSGCDDPPDFLGKHGAWLLTVIASVSALFGVCFTYFLKSRCKNISTPCISCDREVAALESSEMHVTSSTVE